jgi:hypothetical protein
MSRPFQATERGTAMSKPATLIVAVAAVILGIGHLTSFASRYHSLGVASYTTINDKLTSVGAFGIVFVPD